MSENSTSQSITIEGVALAITLLLLGAVVGFLDDQKTYKYQTKPNAKAELLSNLNQFVNAFPALEIALKNNSLSDNQWGQLQQFSYTINKAFSDVKAFGIESKYFGEVQDLITKMSILGNRMLNNKNPPKTYISERNPPRIIGYKIDEEYIKNLKTMADEAKDIMVFAKNLTDKLQKEFNKKKYLIF